MTKTQQIAIVITFGAIAAALTWYFAVYRRRQNLSGVKEGAGLLTWFGCNDNFPIKMRSCGPRVKALQRYFNKKAAERDLTQARLGNITAQVPINVDGKFGQNTMALARRIITEIDFLTKGMSEPEYAAYSQYF